MQARVSPPPYLDTADQILLCVHDVSAFPNVNGNHAHFQMPLPDSDDNCFQLPPVDAMHFQCTYRPQHGGRMLKLPWTLIPLYSNLRFEIEVTLEINYRDRPHQLIGP